MTTYGQWGLAVVLIIITMNDNIFSARAVSHDDIFVSAVRKDQTAVWPPPRFPLFGKYNLATHEEMQQTEDVSDDLQNARDYLLQPEALLDEFSHKTIYDISRSSLGRLYNTKIPVLTQKRKSYSICDIKHPSIFEIIEFLRTRKFCGIKTGYFRFGLGK